MTEPLLERIQKDPAIIYEFADALLAEKKRSTALATELALAKPKADYFDAFINPDDCTNIRTTAKEMKIPERQFVKFLLKEKFLFRSPNGTLLPYNKPSNEGLLIVRDCYIHRCFASQTYFTPMGKDTIRVKYFMTHGDPVKIPA
jgi:phage antirepressor YoqD-like protein